jgi:hypothetical protein
MQLKTEFLNCKKNLGMNGGGTPLDNSNVAVRALIVRHYRITLKLKATIQANSGIESATGIKT